MNYQRAEIIPTHESWKKNTQINLKPCMWKWKDIYSKLINESSGSSLTLVNKSLQDTDSILPNINASIQVLSAGKDNKIHSHRHSMFAIFIVYQGKGYSIIDDEKFEWEKGDVIVAPPMLDHGHCNTSKTEDAILFNIQDIPRVRDMGLWMVEE